MDLRPLLSCFAVAALAIAIWGHLPARLIERANARTITLGVTMGFGAIASMLVPVRIASGIIIDLRGPLVVSAAFMGGPISASIAAGLALAYRIALGGPGVWAGCFITAACAVIGLGGHATGPSHRVTTVGVAMLSVSVAAVTMVSILLLPQPMWGAGYDATAPIVLLSFGCTWLFVMSLRRDDRHRGLIARDAVYRAIIEALPDSLNAKDLQNRFVAANPATARLMGVETPGELIGKTDADFYPEAMARGFLEEERKVLDDAVIGPIDQEVMFADGSRRWLTSMKTPMLDSRGKVCGIITHNRDVTSGKRVEADLLRTQSYLQEAMANMADGLVLYGHDGIIRFCNQQYRNMFPKTAHMRVEGGKFADIIRASILAGEEAPKPDLEAYVADRVRMLHVAGNRLLELQDGRSLELRSRPLPGSDTLVVFTDVTARKQLERDLLRRASQDPLTSLANRAAFEFKLNAVHQQAVAQKTAFAVIMLDLDRFKPVNDTYGHAVGDKLLVEVARRLRRAVREGTLVARLGGDEFAFLIVADEIETAAAGLANRLMESLKKPFRSDDVELMPGGSLGIAYYPRNAADPFELLRLADKALYAVKTRGGGSWLTSQVLAGEAREIGMPNPAAQSAA